MPLRQSAQGILFSDSIGNRMPVLVFGQERADMDDRAYHRGSHIAHVVTAVAALLAAVMFTVLVLWVVMAEQTTKLYESDNVVCASQPLALTCFERKAR